MSCCCAKPSSVRFLQPWDGDILNRHDGKAVEGGLEIAVRGEAPAGAAELLPRVRALCQSELGWSDARWQVEENAYRELCQRAYSLPQRIEIPAEVSV